MTSATLDNARVSAAWNWAHWFIANFGVPGVDRSCANHWTIQGQEFHGPSPAEAIKLKGTAVQLSTSLPWYEIQVLSLPDIPPLLVRTLKGIGGTVAMGLNRLKAVTTVEFKLANSKKQDTSGVDFVRKGFDAACLLAIAELRVEAATAAAEAATKHVGADHQIAGAGAKLAEEFVQGTANSYPYTIVVRDCEYIVELLPWEDVERFRDEGKMPDPVYAGADRRHKWELANEEYRATPDEFNAVYIGRYDPLPTGRDYIAEPWPSMGCFRVENLYGDILFNYLNMAHKPERYRPGTVLHFHAARRDLVFKDWSHTYFDLATDTFHAGGRPVEIEPEEN